jgi:hypothetical protein
VTISPSLSGRRKKAPNDCYSSFSLINDALGHCDANLAASYSQLSAAETTALATERVDQASALGDTLRERESRLSPLLNAHSLTFSVIKRAISFSLNLHGSGYDLLRSPLGFCENIASRGLRLSYEALSFSMR